MNKIYNSNLNKLTPWTKDWIEQTKRIFFFFEAAETKKQGGEIFLNFFYVQGMFKMVIKDAWNALRINEEIKDPS